MYVWFSMCHEIVQCFGPIDPVLTQIHFFNLQSTWHCPDFEHHNMVDILMFRN